RNVRTQRRLDLAAPAIRGLLDGQEARLTGTGRLLVRASGTEPVIRVMVEAQDEALLVDVLDVVSEGIANLAAQAA
ncbi:MAG: phosphoglucosamine mutase, partial [Geminicoccaceae bacterium]